MPLGTLTNITKTAKIVEWTGDEKADTPHSITKITKSASVTDAHGAEQSNEESKSGVSALDIATIVLSLRRLSFPSRRL